MDNIVVGKYLNHHSLVHQFDPRVKLLLLVLSMVLILLPVGWIGYAILGCCFLLLLRLAKIKFSYVWKIFKPMLVMMVLLLFINVLTCQTGLVIADMGFLKVRLDAFVDTFYIVIRLFLMISITSIVTATTMPLDLTMAIEDVLKPFTKLGFPSHIVAMIISIALRFIPTLIEEVQRIMKAQASRGVDYDNANFIQKIKSMFTLIIPLFISAFSKADDLAEAMEARGYNPTGKRTRYRKYQLGAKDYGLILVALVISVAEVLLVLC